MIGMIGPARVMPCHSAMLCPALPYSTVPYCATTRQATPRHNAPPADHILRYGGRCKGLGVGLRRRRRRPVLRLVLEVWSIVVEMVDRLAVWEQ